MKKSGQKSRLSRFKRALYNPEKKEFLGRTCREWVLVFIFYAVSYTFLAAFFVGMLSVFLYGCLNNNVPSLTGNKAFSEVDQELSWQLDRSPIALLFKLREPHLRSIKNMLANMNS
uniref:Uncharacterized protein n=1 Tax=Trichobilharzia regenti TaxID=157069 RepID=A0AA85K0Q5_TRIRE|nr:unnamed protein product [Trichobilharzia regenti]